MTTSHYSFRYYSRQNPTPNLRALSQRVADTPPSLARILATDFGGFATRLFLR